MATANTQRNQPKPGDLTGRQRAAAQKKNAEEQAERARTARRTGIFLMGRAGPLAQQVRMVPGGGLEPPDRFRPTLS